MPRVKRDRAKKAAVKRMDEPLAAIVRRQAAGAAKPTAKPTAKPSKPKAAPKQCAPDRAEAAAEVLEAVWLNENSFELEHKIDPADVIEDKDGNPWVAVRILVPQLDVDMWLEGTHCDHPNNQDEES